MRPYGIKQQPLERVDEPVEFAIDCSVPLTYQFPARLAQHLRLCEAAQTEFPWKQLAVQHYILRPATRGVDSFVEKPWSSSKHWSCSNPTCQLVSGPAATSQATWCQLPRI